MIPNPVGSVLVINFGGPELNELARYLAHRGRLRGFVRPYVNKGRAWERGLARLPLLGSLYLQTFGRRRIDDPLLLGHTREAGVAADIAAAVVARMPGLSPDRRRWVTYYFHEAVRHAVSREGPRHTQGAGAVVAFPGFAREAFRAVHAAGGLSVLNYPIAHHRYHQRVRLEEMARDPDFAPMWPGFDDWTPAYTAQIDGEVDAADLILVGSSFARDSFCEEGIDPVKIAVAEYGVDPEMFAPALADGPPRGGFRVMYSGQIGQRKGISYLLKGYAAFAKPDTELALVGQLVGVTTPLKPYAHLFRHIPHLTRPDLAEAYRDSDVFVFPSLVEGMGLVVLEAMACGLPVIVSPNGPGDLVRDGVDGFVIPIRDPEAIRDRLERLYRDPLLRAEMGRNARARALQYDWSAYAAKADQCIAAAAARSALARA